MKRCLLLMEAVDVTGDQKGDFKNLKEKETGGGGWEPPCQALEKFSSLFVCVGGSHLHLASLAPCLSI